MLLSLSALLGSVSRHTKDKYRIAKLSLLPFSRTESYMTRFNSGYVFVIAERCTTPRGYLIIWVCRRRLVTLFEYLCELQYLYINPSTFWDSTCVLYDRLLDGQTTEKLVHPRKRKKDCALTVATSCLGIGTPYPTWAKVSAHEQFEACTCLHTDLRHGHEEASGRNKAWNNKLGRVVHLLHASIK